MSTYRPKSIHDFLRYGGTEDVVNKVTNAIRGFRHISGLPLIADNVDGVGYTFFSRPLMNLTDRNLRNVPELDKFLTEKSMSIPRMVRTLLDPRLQYGLPNHPLYKQDKLYSPLNDNSHAFISVLSNNLKSLSGWPSIKVPSYTSTPGLRKEQWAMVDGPYTVYDKFDLSAVFKNFKTEPITTLLELWIRYPFLVYEGSLTQYIDVMWDFAKDYETSIYRFITDESGRFIKKTARVVAAYPDNEDTGKTFDFAIGNVHSEGGSDINVNFVSQIAEYNLAASLLDFNKTSASFNPDVYSYLIDTTKDKSDNPMDVIPVELLEAFDGKGYPIIDLETNELLWLINKNTPSYKKIVDVLIDKKETTVYNKIQV